MPTTPTITINTNGSFNLEGQGLSGKVISKGRIQWGAVQFTPNPSSSEFIGMVNDDEYAVVKLQSVIAGRQLNFDSDTVDNAKRTISDSNIPLFTLSSYTIDNTIPLLVTQCFINFTDNTSVTLKDNTLIVNTSP